MLSGLLRGCSPRSHSCLPAHHQGLENGDIATSRIKQVASGRFGVTPEYLVNADQLEIKVWMGVDGPPASWCAASCTYHPYDFA